MAMMQQDLKPQNPPPHDEELDELYEDEPRRRSWGAITSVVLALALLFVGYQWHQATGREQLLVSQVNALRADAETQRLRAEEAQRHLDGLQKRVAAMSAEKETLAERVAALGKVSRERAGTTAREPLRARATPVATKKPR